jgi:hypothetical protein
MSIDRVTAITPIFSHEKMIITGLLVSERFNIDVGLRINPDMFQETWQRKLIRALLEYFKTYQQPCRTNVGTIVTDIRSELTDAEYDLITYCLESISTDLDKANGSINEQLYTKTANTFLNSYILKAHAERITGLIACGKIDDALTEATTFQTSTSGATPNYHTIGDLKNYGFLNHVDDEEDDRVLFKFRGALNDLVGPLKRSWLVAFLGAMKRGKSNFLMETAYTAAIAGRKVYVALHEMQVEEWSDRLLSTITGNALHPDDFDNRPQFDCARNRDGSCTAPARCNRDIYMDGHNPKYRVCLQCEKVAGSNFKVCVSTPPSPIIVATQDSAREAITRLSFKDNVIVEKFDTGSANCQTMRNRLRQLQLDLGFYADVLVSDYADIQAPEDSRVIDSRQRINDTWINLKRLADEFGILVATATQGTRITLEKEDIGATDISDSIKKAAHLDIMLGISQKEEEKMRGIIHLNTLLHRHRKFSESRVVTVLQHLETGQYALASRWGRIS